MDRTNLCDSLVAWIKTFNFTKPDQAIDFRDGIIISKCLHHIDPEYFDEEWLLKIKIDNDNWRLKLLNLKKILEAISDYYAEVINHSLNGFQMPNLNLFIETNDQEELSRLLQLVLGCAVNCDKKSDYINIIMGMPVDTQHMIMTAIQDLMTKERSKSNDEDLNYQLKKTLLELNRVNEQKEELEQKCKSLDSQVSIIQDEKMALISEIEMLKEKLQRDDNTRDEINKQKKLQQKIDIIQEELYKLEAVKEEYRIKCEATKAENDLLIQKNTELKKISQDTQALKDELDILRHNTDKVSKLETTIQTYKIKLEEMTDLKKQILLLEETNTKYMEQIIQMEEEAKKITSLKSQIELYKKQIQELHENLLSQEMKVKTYEYENKRHEERLSATQQEKERLLNELNSLKETNEELQIMNAISNNNAALTSINRSHSDEKANDAGSNIFSELELFNLPLELKEKIFRLCHENKMLKSKQNDLNEEKLVLLQNQYDDEKQRNSDLQAKLNLTQAQIIELESKISDLKIKSESKEQTNSSNSKLNDLIEFKNKLTVKNSLLEDELKKSSLMIQSLESKIELLSNEKNELKEKLGLKEKEINEIHDNYRNYLEKAKVVIKSLDPSNSQSISSEFQILKNTITEKDKKIVKLTKEIEKLKGSHEKESQLLASAWHKLVVNANRESTEDRINSLGSSFLAQQRNLSKRQSIPSNIPAAIQNHTNKNF